MSNMSSRILPPLAVRNKFRITVNQVRHFQELHASNVLILGIFVHLFIHTIFVSFHHSFLVFLSVIHLCIQSHIQLLLFLCFLSFSLFFISFPFFPCYLILPFILIHPFIHLVFVSIIISLPFVQLFLSMFIYLIFTYQFIDLVMGYTVHQLSISFCWNFSLESTS